jgi:hypothetical protein
VATVVIVAFAVMFIAGYLCGISDAINFGDYPSLDLRGKASYEPASTGWRKKAPARGLVGFVFALLVASLTAIQAKAVSVHGGQIVTVTEPIESRFSEAVFVPNEPPNKEKSAMCIHLLRETDQTYFFNSSTAFYGLRSRCDVNRLFQSPLVYVEDKWPETFTEFAAYHPRDIFGGQVPDIPKSDIRRKVFAANEGFYSKRIDADIGTLKDFSLIGLCFSGVDCGYPELSRGKPQEDCRYSDNDSKGCDNTLVVNFKEMTKSEYQQRKRALEDGTVFIAVLAGAGVIWWWVACFK